MVIEHQVSGLIDLGVSRQIPASSTGCVQYFVYSHSISLSLTLDQTCACMSMRTSQ